MALKPAAGALSVAALLATLALVTANNFHHGYITWKICEDIDADGTKAPGFYDPAYPDVCSGKRQSVTCDPAVDNSCTRWVGATLHVAFNTMHDADSMVPPTEYAQLLSDIGSDGSGIKYNNPDCTYGESCFINVLRDVVAANTDAGILEERFKARRIGFREGRQDAGPVTGGEVVSCPVKGANCPSAYYRMVVDRFSFDVETVDPGRYNYADEYSASDSVGSASDPRFIYAHFSFEMQLPVDTDVTIFFEGCCRPSVVRGDPNAVGSSNNMINVFKAACTSPGQFCISNSLRNGIGTEITDFSSPVRSAAFYLYSELRVVRSEQYQGVGTRYPISSFVFASSNIVRAAPNGLSTCDNALNSDQYTIQNRFLIGGFHPEVAFHNTLQYSLGDAVSRGGCPADCVAGQCSSTCTERCCYNNLLAVDQDTYAVVEPPDVVTGGIVTLAEGGIVTLTKNLEGNFAMNVEAEILIDQRTYKCNMDIIVQIIESVETADRNDAPAPFYHQDIINLMPSYVHPIAMQCGRPTFSLSDGSITYSRDYLDIHFKDFDEIRTTGTGAAACNLQSATSQTVDFIDQANTLPFGAVISAPTTILDADSTNPGSHKSVRLTWQPKCEVRSDIGMFLMCFGARDDQDRPQITTDDARDTRILDNAFLLQTPQSFFPENQHGWRTYDSCGVSAQLEGKSECRSNPSCLYVRVDAFPANPRPRFVVTREDSEVENTIEACNDAENCLIGNDDPGYCRGEQQSVAQGKTIEMTFFTQSENTYFQLQMNISFECVTGCDTETDPDKIVQPPTISNEKFGCNKIWKGPGMVTGADGTCEDMPTVDNHFDVGRRFEFTAPARLSSRKTFLVCLQTFQMVPSDISLSAWNDLYGATPNTDTCKTCFDLQVVPGPTLEALDGPSPTGMQLPGSPPSVIAYIGIEKTFSLRAEGRLPLLQVMILADPGAPAHSELRSCSENNYCQRFDQGLEKYITEREFSFTPRVGQEGTTFKLRFMARNEDTSGSILFSNPLEMEITVMLFDVDWGLTQPCMPVPVGYPQETRDAGDCNSAGEITATVGCTQVHNLVATLKPSPGVSLGSEVITYTEFLNDQGFVMEEYASCSQEEWCPDVMSVNKCGPEQMGACCGNGICDGAETGSNCAEDCEPDDYSFEMTSAIVPSSTVRGVLRYTPIQQQLGRNLLVCVMVSFKESRGGSSVVSHNRTQHTASSLCMKMVVASCKYCVPQGKTLKSIARHYFLNVDWLRLYNSNPTIMDPDDLSLMKEIFVGPQYTVQSGDTLLSIAAQMRTTVKSIMTNNPSVPMDGMINPGDKVCVLVCSSV